MKFKTFFAMFCMLFIGFTAFAQYDSDIPSSEDFEIVNRSADLNSALFNDLSPIGTNVVHSVYVLNENVDMSSSVFDVHLDKAVSYSEKDVVSTILKNQSKSIEPKKLLVSTYCKELEMEIYLYSDMTYGVIHKPPLNQISISEIRKS